MIPFLNVTAWVFLVIGIFMMFLRLRAEYKYENNRFAQTVDKLSGVKRTFPIRNWFFVSLFSAIWLVSRLFA